MASRLVGLGVSVRHIHTLVREQRHVMARFWLAGTLASWRPPRPRRPARRPAHPEATGVRGGPVGRRSGQRLTPPVPGPVCGVAAVPWPARRDQHRCLLQGVTCDHARWWPGIAATDRLSERNHEILVVKTCGRALPQASVAARSHASSSRTR
jgi:hypothetical protein